MLRRKGLAFLLGICLSIGNATRGMRCLTSEDREWRILARSPRFAYFGLGVTFVVFQHLK
jgi:hypothetical protein